MQKANQQNPKNTKEELKVTKGEKEKDKAKKGKHMDLSVCICFALSVFV